MQTCAQPTALETHCRQLDAQPMQAPHHQDNSKKDQLWSAFFISSAFIHS
jgi:hypothetical protein